MTFRLNFFSVWHFSHFTAFWSFMNRLDVSWPSFIPLLLLLLNAVIFRDFCNLSENLARFCRFLPLSSCSPSYQSGTRRPDNRAPLGVARVKMWRLDASLMAQHPVLIFTWRRPARCVDRDDRETFRIRPLMSSRTIRIRDEGEWRGVGGT